MRNSVRSEEGAPYDGSRWMKLPCTGASDQASSVSLPSMSGLCASVILNAIARKLSGSTVLMSKGAAGPFCADDTGANTAANATASPAANHDLNIEGDIVPATLDV